MTPAAAGGGSFFVMTQPCFSLAVNKPFGQGVLDAPTLIENALFSYEQLQPGQFFYDVAGARVYYAPLNADEKTRLVSGASDVILPVAVKLLELNAGVTGVSFHNIVFEHATWLDPSSGTGYVEIQVERD